MDQISKMDQNPKLDHNPKNWLKSNNGSKMKKKSQSIFQKYQIIVISCQKSRFLTLNWAFKYLEKNWRFSDQSWHSLQNLNFWTKTGGLEQCETLKRSVLVWFPLLNHTEADSGTIDQYPEWLLHTLWQHVSRSCNPDFSPQWISQQSWDWYPVRTQCTLS